MKKVLALVLAVMMLSTMAFAAAQPNDNQTTSTSNKISYTGGQFMPGGKIYVYKDMDAGDKDVSGDVEGDFDKEVNSTNYSLSKVKYEEGKSLVEDIYFDDDNDQLVIELKDNDNLTTTKTLDMSFTLKGRSRNVGDVDVWIVTDVGYGLLERAYLIADTDEVNFNTWYTNNGRNDNEEKYFYEVINFKTKDGDGASYGTLEYDTSDPDVEMEVRVYDGDKLYLYNNTKADKDILKAYADSDADLTFLNFPGDTTFNATATLYMYKDEDSFVYEVKNGKLVESNAKWDDDEGAFILKARTLGSYVFSDVELDTVTETVDDTVTNPDTGANDVVGIAAALGVVALVSAAAVSLKK